MGVAVAVGVSEDGRPIPVVAVIPYEAVIPVVKKFINSCIKPGAQSAPFTPSALGG